LLRGEAHFTVAHNVERPFGVHAVWHVVQAVGTAFNVRLQQGGAAEVTVTEGVVQILDDAQTTTTDAIALADDWWTRPALGAGLLPGQVAVFDARSGTAKAPEVRKLDPEDIEIRLAWQDGMLIFESEPLNEVLAEFSRYTAVEFALEDARLGDQRIGGLIGAGDIEGLLNTLRDNFQIEAERESEARIVLRQRN
jgi:transmembrane sensor